MPDNSNKPALLIVDRDPLSLDQLTAVLGNVFLVTASNSRKHACTLLRQIAVRPQLALVSLRPTQGHKDDPRRLLDDLLSLSPGIKIVVLADSHDADAAREARALGAVDYLLRPFDPARLTRLLQQLQPYSAADTSERGQLLGHSAVLQKLRSQISLYADLAAPVLIHGETGSGKKAVAQALHRLSCRKQAPCLLLRCTTPEDVEALLFGRAPGTAMRTAAQQDETGLLEQTGAGTLVLDQIDALPLTAQARLLRVLENGEYQRAGETQRRHSAARILATTRQDLRQAVRDGTFRSDLYHRLSAFTVEVPALRDMEGDRLSLLEYFRAFYGERARQPVFTFDESACKLWHQYSFPGNVRELQHIVLRLLIRHAGRRLSAAELEAELATTCPAEGAHALPEDPRARLEHAQRHLQSQAAFRLDDMLKSWEQGYIDAAMQLTQGNVTQAARLLGINRTTLYSRLEARQRQTSA